MNTFKFLTPDFNHPCVKLLRKHLNISKKSLRAGDNISPENPVLLWNPYGYLVTDRNKWKFELYEYLRKINHPVYIIERGALPNTVFMDKNGFLVDSSSYDESRWNHLLTEVQKEKINQYIDNFKKDNTSLETQKNNRPSFGLFCDMLNINLNKYNRIIFVPLQVHDDTVTLLWSNWIENTTNFNILIKKLAQEYPTWLFLVKNHPIEKEDKYHINKETKNLRIVDNFHYKSMIEYSDLILTINSGIGLQAMMWKKPVVIVGEAFYNFKDINQKVSSIYDIEAIINMFTKYPDMNKVKRFLYYLKYNFYSECILKNVKHKKWNLFTDIKRIVLQHPYEDRIIIKEI